MVVCALHFMSMKQKGQLPIILRPMLLMWHMTVVPLHFQQGLDHLYVFGTYRPSEWWNGEICCVGLGQRDVRQENQILLNVIADLV